MASFHTTRSVLAACEQRRVLVFQKGSIAMVRRRLAPWEARPWRACQGQIRRAGNAAWVRPVTLNE